MDEEPNEEELKILKNLGYDFDDHEDDEFDEPTKDNKPH